MRRDVLIDGLQGMEALGSLNADGISGFSKVIGCLIEGWSF